jgi:transcription-repair coupling factor (superfamily II helicase)
MSERADLIFTGVPEGLDALVLARLVEEAADGAHAGLLVHVARDDRRLEALEGQLRFFAPKVRVVPFPAWDTVPYDRVSPNAEIVAKRITALSRLVLSSRSEPVVVLTTINAILQRVPPRAFIRNAMKSIAPGQRVDLNRLVERLSRAGYTRTGTVMEPGEYAVRGGILDLFPPGGRTRCGSISSAIRSRASRRSTPRRNGPQSRSGSSSSCRSRRWRSERRQPLCSGPATSNCSAARRGTIRSTRP